MSGCPSESRDCDCERNLEASVRDVSHAQAETLCSQALLWQCRMRSHAPDKGTGTAYIQKT